MALNIAMLKVKGKCFNFMVVGFLKWLIHAKPPTVFAKVSDVSCPMLGHEKAQNGRMVSHRHFFSEYRGGFCRVFIECCCFRHVMIIGGSFETLGGPS